MPLIDSHPDALARTYAQSLFDLALDQGGRERLEALSGEMDELVQLTREMPQLSEFMASRILPMQDRARSLNTMFGGRVSDLLLKFLQVLNRKERLDALLPIAAAFDSLVQERFGRIEVDIYTQSDIDPAEVDSFRDRLRDALQREPVIHTYTDPAMLGGVKIQIGDRLIDASLATRLRKMRELLTVEGAGLMRERFEQAVMDEQNEQ